MFLLIKILNKILFREKMHDAQDKDNWGFLMEMLKVSKKYLNL